MRHTEPAGSARAQRLRRRLLRHHLPLALACLVALACLAALLQHDRGVTRLTVASAYVGMALLATTLALGPLNILRGRPNPISTDLRRDVGIWAALVSLLHVAAGLMTHFPGEPWRFFIDDGRLPLLMNRFGAANYTGLGATLILVLLLALSNDRALRALRGQRWKALQRLNYALFGLVAAHALVYLPYEDRGLRFLLPLALIVTLTAAIQAAGYVARRRLRRDAVPAPSQTAQPLG